MSATSGVFSAGPGLMARASPRRKFGSYKSGILNPRRSKTAFSASISSRRSGSLFRRRQVRLWRTTASIKGQNERFSKLYVCSNRYVIAGRLLPGAQYFSTPTCSAAIGNASRALPLPGRKSYRMSAKSARAWLSLMEIATGPIIPAFPIFLQIRVQFKAKSVLSRHSRRSKWLVSLHQLFKPGGRNPAISTAGSEEEGADRNTESKPPFRLFIRAGRSRSTLTSLK